MDWFRRGHGLFAVLAGSTTDAGARSFLVCLAIYSDALIALLQINFGQIVLVHQLDEFAHLLYIKNVARNGTRIRTHQCIPAGNSIRVLYVTIGPDGQDANTQSSSCFGTSVRTS